MRRLNLGSGVGYGDPADGWVNVDKTPPKGTEQITMAYDLDDMPWPWPDDHFDEARAHHVAEHLRDKLAFLEELWRVCSHAAPVLLATPNCINNVNYWHDPTHRLPWHPGNLEYFAPGYPWGYYTSARFVTVSVAHTPELLEWLLATYKRDDPELAAQQADWHESNWDGSRG